MGQARQHPKPKSFSGGHAHAAALGPSRPQPLLVAIVGGSGAGKSWLAERLQQALPGRVARLSLDDFYRDRSHLSPARRVKLNFDNPKAIDWSCFESVLRDLARSRSVRVPTYDFKTHSRLDREHVLKPRPIVLVEGLWLLARRSVRRHFRLRIFLSAGKSIRLSRRLARDLRSRGRTRGSVLLQFRSTVEPMHIKYVEPQKRFADLILARSSLAEVKELAGLILKMADGS